MNLAWGAATRWPVGLGTRDFPPLLKRGGGKNCCGPAGARLGSASWWPLRGQGRTGDLGEVPAPSPGSYKHLPPPPRNPRPPGTEDLTPPLRFPGVGGFLHGDFVTRSPCGPFASPLGPRLRHFVFLNRSHLHTTFSFIKNTAERGELWAPAVRGSVCVRVPVPVGVLEPPPGSCGECECVCTRVCARDGRPAGSG